MEPSDLVDQCYQYRSQAWELARVSLKGWLEDQCSELLRDGDPMRLRVEDGRIKEKDRALQKLLRRLDAKPDLELSTWQQVEAELGDVVGLKVLCKSTRDQRLLAEHLSSVADVPGIKIVAELRNYATGPKPTGYRAVHVKFAVEVPGNGEPVPVELQIKTRLQDAWGELTHEDLYKPGGGLNPSPFHESVAKTIADLLAIVDGLADDLASEIESTLQVAANAPQSDESIVVTVRTSGPKYALADDMNGRRGLIPAYAVRDLCGKKFISVDDYLSRGQKLEVRVIDNDEGVFYIPVSLPDR